MLFNGRVPILTFSRTKFRIADHERLQSLFEGVYDRDRGEVEAERCDLWLSCHHSLPRAV